MLRPNAIVAIPLNAPKSLSYIAADVPCVAADGGIHTALQLQLHCTAIIGDMDSINESDLPQPLDIPVYSYPREKDESDAALALRFAHKTYGSNIVLIGGNGGRVDHFFAILSQYNGDFYPSFWITDASCVVFCKDTFSLTAPLGTQISVFSHMFRRAKFSTKGLHWPFTELSDTLVSLSNKTCDTHVSISSDAAFLVVFDESAFSSVEILRHTYN